MMYLIMPTTIYSSTTYSPKTASVLKVYTLIKRYIKAYKLLNLVLHTKYNTWYEI